jgi:hypothetical protein
VIRRIFGVDVTPEEQEDLDPMVIEYAGKMLALALCTPGIDFWSTQIIAQSSGEQSSESYANRANHLKDLRKQWMTETSDLYVDIEALLPIRPRRAGDAPRVVQAGENEPHVTPQPFDIGPLAGPPEEVLEQ